MEYQCLEDFTEELKDKISNINEQRKAFLVEVVMICILI